MSLKKYCLFLIFFAFKNIICFFYIFWHKKIYCMFFIFFGYKKILWCFDILKFKNIVLFIFCGPIFILSYSLIAQLELFHYRNSTIRCFLSVEIFIFGVVFDTGNQMILVRGIFCSFGVITANFWFEFEPFLKFESFLFFQVGSA